MLEALVLWNEPNNLSHWDFNLDPEWMRSRETVKLTSAASRAVNPQIPIMLSSIPVCHCNFLALAHSCGLMDAEGAVHGSLPDRSHLQLDGPRSAARSGRRRPDCVAESKEENNAYMRSENAHNFLLLRELDYEAGACAS